ncbi:MAG TPA: hypothetical protein VGR84_03275 [Candidatus Acidoferrales bacterium]|nr:hypothetical protein [Candidatus Acidoferrales bacterium]
MSQEDLKLRKQTAATEPAAAAEAKPNLEDPKVVLSLLEADQVVAAKTRTRFGKRKLSAGTRAMLWGLRIYVFVMLVIVLISVIRAVHGGQ